MLLITSPTGHMSWVTGTAEAGFQALGAVGIHLPNWAILFLFLPQPLAPSISVLQTRDFECGTTVSSETAQSISASITVFIITLASFFKTDSAWGEFFSHRSRIWGNSSECMSALRSYLALP